MDELGKRMSPLQIAYVGLALSIAGTLISTAAIVLLAARPW